MFRLIIIIIINFITVLNSIQAESKIAELEKKSFLLASNTDYNQEEDLTSSFADFAVLQVLNKVTAKSSQFKARVGEKVLFGRLKIFVYRCWQAPLDQKPESKALLEIYNVNVDSLEEKIFYGWMFASSPSISGLEHPIYDVSVINCELN